MSGFFWNIRGFNKVSKHNVVRNWIKKEGLQFGCLIETRVKEKNSVRIASSVFRDWSFISNYDSSRLGKIWIVWSSKVRVTPCFTSKQMITCYVLLEGMSEEVICSFVYAANTAEERKELWQDIRNHQDAPAFRSKPWLIFGDFNEILDVSEHSGYEDDPSIPAGMRDFQEVVRYCSLGDMTYHGPKMTWCNKREEGIIRKKLDRTLVNQTWANNYADSYCVFEAGGCSDHQRCRIRILADPHKPKRPFKFVNAITEMPDFLDRVESYWKGTEEIFNSTSALFRLSKKLKLMKPMIREMCKKSIADISKKTKEAFDLLCDLQQQILLNPTPNVIQSENEAFARWSLLSSIEEKVISQKAKIHWLKVGDGNNKHFYQVATLRKSKNAIKELKREDGSVADTQEEIKYEAVEYFKGYLAHKVNNYQEPSVEDLCDLLAFECGEEDRNLLVQTVTEVEIKKVLFAMANNKSPGPDGYTAEFYKAAWPVIGKEFVVAVKSFFDTGFLPKGVNSTILALIPKKEVAENIKDYRPISCCNVIYKVISKILANRLKQLLPKFISPNQSAFVKGRLLMENVLLASELVKNYHKENITPRCAIKIDISKAFDSVQWPFLLNTLSALKIPERFITWIQKCITLASFSVQVNGELAGYFNSERGLRQGCSLSPYLFVICMEVLSKLIDKGAVNKHIGYHPKCQALKLTHLCFADDLLVFSDGRKESIEAILGVFDHFAGSSGLRISLEKTTIYMAGINDQEKEEIQEHFTFGTGSLPVRYLGLPLLTKKMNISDYLPLIEKVRSRISSWTARHLSFAGRLQLIASVITSLTNFWISAYRLPKGCIKEIEQLCSAFLWSGPELNTKKAKVAWKDVTKPKEEGGLGLRSLSEANDVSSIKLIWRIISAPSSLWVRWVHKYLIRKGSFWSTSKKTTLGSWMWRKILKIRHVAASLTKTEIQSGADVSFWFDIWCPLGRIIDLTGDRGCIDLGIKITATVEQAVMSRRRRRHRNDTLNRIEEELQKLRERGLTKERDVRLWKGRKEYKTIFSSKNTWINTRTAQPKVAWSRGIWFGFNTPKFSVMVWLAALNRLSTGDKIRLWNSQADTTCVLCRNEEEDRDHLFFRCSYSAQVWTQLASKLFDRDFSSQWDRVIESISSSTWPKLRLFLCRYLFQTTVYNLWRERNLRNHGENPRPYSVLVRQIDKQVRNRLSSIAREDNSKHTGALQLWFAFHTS